MAEVLDFVPEEETAEQVEEENQEKRFYLEFDKDTIQERISAQNTFYSIKLPRGTMIDGKDLSGWRLAQNYLFPSHFHDNMMCATFPSDIFKVTLTRPYLNENKQYEQESTRVTVGALKDALADAPDIAETMPAPEPEHKKGKVYVEFDLNDVQERQNSKGETFYSIRLPKDFTIDGKNYGGWTLTQSKMFDSKFDEQKKVASFPSEDFEVNLSHSIKQQDDTWAQEKTRVKAESLKKASTSHAR